MKYQCVIFDLDGTLLNTSQGILESIRYAVDTLGYPQLSLAQLLTFIGPPLADSFIRCYGCSEEEAARLTDAYREFYPTGPVYHAVPYDGLFELLQKLRRLKVCLAVATNKPVKYSGVILRHFGLDRYISILHGADLEGKLSKADLIRMCVEDAGRGDDDPSGDVVRIGRGASVGADLSADAVPLTPSDCVMIGDSVSDACGAMEAGVPFLGVTYGFGDLEEMKKFPNIGFASTPAEVWEMLQK